jgi:aspartyl-tRNA(Asn)/glutamyl-tRNA(Gln) amidotransferase subunit B
MTGEWLAKIRAEIPELPKARTKRFIEQYGLSEYDAGVIVADRRIADYFEKLAEKTKDARRSCIWVTQTLMRALNTGIITIDRIPVSLDDVADSMKLVADNTISITVANTVIWPEMMATGKSAKEIVAEKGLAQVSDASALDGAVDAVIARNPRQVEQYRSGKEGVFNFLVGMVMKETKGKANPQVVTDLLKKKLGGGKPG